MRALTRAHLGLAVLGLGTAVVPLDSAVNIAFPDITGAFRLEMREIRWVIVAYVLTHASLMLIFGKLGDAIGYRLIFQFGLAIGFAGFIACSVAPSFGTLLAARCLQGVGAALILACGPALATSLYDESRRTHALAAYAALAAVGAMLGPLLGGVLVARWGWPAVFWARAPLVAIALACSWVIPRRAAAGSTRGFDALGALLLVAAMVGFLLAATLRWEGVDGALACVSTGLGAAALIAFVAHERRHATPIIRPAIFTDPSFSAFNLASVIVFLTGFSVMLLTPYWLSRVAGLETTLAGVVLASNPAGIGLGAWLAGRVAARVADSTITMLGIAATVAGLVTISMWTPSTPVTWLIATLLVQGCGVGMFQVAYTDHVTAALPMAERGVAGSLTMVTRTVGVIGGAAGLSRLQRWYETGWLAAGTSEAEAFRLGYGSTFRTIAVLMAAILLATIVARLLERAKLGASERN